MTASTALPRIYVDGHFSVMSASVVSSQRLIVSSVLGIFTKANSKLSSTRNTSQCKRQQATFSFKPDFLHFSYTPALHVLRDHA